MNHPTFDGGFRQDLKLMHEKMNQSDLVQVRAAKRRQLIGALSAGSFLHLSGCGAGSSSTTSPISGTIAGQTPAAQAPAGAGSSGTCSVIPSETAGPYPGDGTNSAPGLTSNALTLNGIQRSDIRASFAGATGVAGGVPLTLTLNLKNANSSCGGLSGYAIYLWHCDALGRYSLYSSGATGENYLRGLQITNADGQVSFTTIVPGCYDGRWPHMHFEIFSSVAAATRGSNAVKTTQLALTQAVASAVYATSGYNNSSTNLARVSLVSDNVFSDGSALQVANFSGSVAAGYSASLDVNIAA